MDTPVPPAPPVPPGFSVPTTPSVPPAPPAPPPAQQVPPPDRADEHGPAPLLPGQLSPGWRMIFIAGWVGVLAGFGAIWQAGRIAGIAPWWLGPETNPRFVLVIAVPFVAPLITVVAGVMGRTWACYVGIAAGVVSAAMALGDLHYPGLAVVDAIIGFCGLLISIACLGGRMRPAPDTTDATNIDPFAAP